MNKKRKIHFHVGLGKTGSTFLQDRVFPHFKGQLYIHRKDYLRAKSIAAKSPTQDILLSYECDQQLESVCREWAEEYPETQVIIVFRKHGAWLASQYRRFVKNCELRTFEDLYHIDGTSGRFKDKDLNYRGMLSMIERCFELPPIVLLYDDMKADRSHFIEQMSTDIGSSVDLTNVDMSTHHSSYSQKQLQGLQVMSRYINLKNRVVFKNRTLDFIRKLPINGMRYFILYVSKILPESWFDKAPLIPADLLSAVDLKYKSDWDYIIDRAQLQKASRSKS